MNKSSSIYRLVPSQEVATHGGKAGERIRVIEVEENQHTIHAITA